VDGRAEYLPTTSRNVCWFGLTGISIRTKPWVGGTEGPTARVFILGSANFPWRDSKFESCPLQQRVHELSVPRLRGPDITRPDLESEYHSAGRLDKRHPVGPDHRPAALGEEILDVSVAERETQVDPHGMLDENRPTLY